MSDAFEGNVVDVEARRVFPARVLVEGGRVAAIEAVKGPCSTFLLPGFIDAHVHIESAMLVPSEFARVAVTHGTVATVSDPHEIANVLGAAGIEFMIDNARASGFKCCFGAPSCVPATGADLETAGARLGPEEITRLLERPEIRYLSEMMNFPGVLHGDPEVVAKLAAARRLGKPVDGHAPGLTGEDLQRYIDAGITTDHEAVSYAEAREKIERGMHILLREGSAAKNFEALHPLISEFPERVMLCSDDRHPDDLVDGHIDRLVARAVAKGHDLFDVLRAASVNAIDHYGLDVGRLRVGDPADFVEVADLTEFRVLRTVIDGRLAAEHGETRLPRVATSRPNRFEARPKHPEDFQVRGDSGTYRVVQAFDQRLYTGEAHVALDARNGVVQPAPERDVLLLTVVNRYRDAPPAVAFVQGFGLEHGALASSVAHDSHNIVAVGCDAEALCAAVNHVIEHRGGIVAVDGRGEARVLPLPVAGLMTDADGFETGHAYRALDRFARERLGSTLSAPFMTLSFMALLVIPALKLSDKGLFDGTRFQFVAPRAA